MSLKAMNWVMESAPVTDPTSLLVLYALADRANEDGTAAFPSQEWLAERARCSVRTVRRKLAGLEGAGVIRKGNPKFVEHIREDRRPTVWNLCYWATERPDNSVRADKLTGRTELCPAVQPERADTAMSYPPKSGRTAVTERADTCDRATGHPGSYDRTQLCPTNRPEPSLTVQEPSNSDQLNQKFDSNDEGLFDEFWNVVPRKVSKKAARKAFIKAIETTDPQTIIDGMRRYRDDPNREDAFTKHPSTWLNQGCWEDEPIPPKPTAHSTGRMSNAETIRQLQEKNNQTTTTHHQPELKDWFTQQALEGPQP